MTILLNQLNFRRLKRRLRGCCLLVAVGLLLGCGLLIWLSFLWADRAAAQQEQPHDVLLVIDNSNSMFETAGAGSDPDLLRIQAARLLVAGLAAASQPAPYRVGVIFFSGQAELAAPLTSLADPVGHRSVVEVLNNPTPLAWTDPAAALELTLATLSGGSGSRQTAILLTDGRPEGPTPTTPADPNDQNARLRSIAGRFAMAGIPLHIVLLHNPAVTAEPEMASVVRPLWPDMAAATGGRFYQVEKSDDLPHIFHEIMVSLTGRETAGMVLQAPVQPPSRHTIAVQPNLAQTSFVILKSSPAITTEIFQPDGRRLAPAPTGVTYNGWPGSYEEVWSVSQPPPGDWQLRFTGQGQITVWQDDQPAPATPTPFSTSIPTATTTPLPHQVALPSIPVASIQPTSSTVQGRTDSPTGEAGSDSTPSQLPLAEGRGQNIPSGGERIIQSDQSHFGRWFWLMLSLLVLLLFGGGGLWLKKRPGSPPVSGQLRRLAAPNGSEPALSRIDLDRFNQPQVQLGPDRTADVVLINPAAGPGLPTVTLLTRPGVETEVTTYLRVDRANGSEVRLNDRQVHQACPLFDSDIIGLGEYQFRFENLRCRRPGSNRPVTAYGNRHMSSLLGR